MLPKLNVLNPCATTEFSTSPENPPTVKPPTWATSQAHVKQPEKSPPSGSEAAWLPARCPADTLPRFLPLAWGQGTGERDPQITLNPASLLFYRPDPQRLGERFLGAAVESSFLSLGGERYGIQRPHLASAMGCPQGLCDTGPVLNGGLVDQLGLVGCVRGTTPSRL
ncbi:unnamed protein product [Gadus morhua 'NCC']